MQVTRENLNPTKVKLTIAADEKQLEQAKQQSLRVVAKDMRLPGFRPGKAPLTLVEKHANPNVLQQDFLERAMNLAYGQALAQEKLQPIAQPEVTISKFVPYDLLEIVAEVEVIGEIKLSDYRKLRVAKKEVKITAKDVDAVIEQLQQREAVKTDVDRAAKNGDQVTIDFRGVDAKSGEPINGADGKQYPLMLGSDSFIPGFEENLVGIKTGEEKIFQITFPKDYGVTALQSRKVEFTVTVHKIQAVELPKVDAEFAAKVGPFKDVAELKDDIKKQLTAEQETQAQRTYEEEILNTVADKATVEIPASLIDQEISRMEADERQNLMYRGQTWQEHLEAEGVTEAQHREQNRGQAERRVKAGLVLAEIAERERITIDRAEAEQRLTELKSRYQDKAMQAELNKPENQREIASRLLTEKTIAKLVGYASAK
jgi:trigger factor